MAIDYIGITEAILIASVLALLTWIAKTLRDNNTAILLIQQDIVYIKLAQDEAKENRYTKSQALVDRQRIDDEIADMQARLDKIERHLDIR